MEDSKSLDVPTNIELHKDYTVSLSYCCLSYTHTFSKESQLPYFALVIGP